MISNLLFRFQLYLILLVPFFLVSGPALSDIAISLSGASFIIYYLLNKKTFSINYYILSVFFIFYLYLLLISFGSENYLLSLQSSLFYFRFIFFALSVNLVFYNNYNNCKKLFFVFLVTFSLIIVDSYIQYFTGINLFGFEYDGIRLSSFFNEEKKLGSYLSRLTPIFLGLSIFVYGNNKIKIIFILFLVLQIDIIVILSGERSSIFYIFLSTLIISILIKRWKIYRLIAFGISMIVSTYIITSNAQVKERVILKTIDQTKIFSEKINTFSIQHQVIYSTAFKIFKDNKIIGIGPKMFREKCKIKKYKTYTDEDGSVDGCQSHPHNSYIQLLVETGILGFMLIISFFIILNLYFIRHLFLMIRKRIYLISDYNICFLSAVYINLWPIVPTGSFFNNWLSIIYFLPLGFFLPLLKSSDYK